MRMPTSIRYASRVEETGFSASIGSVGDSYNNALAGTVNGLYQAECVFWEGPRAGADDLELATPFLGALVQPRAHPLRPRPATADRVRAEPLRSSNHVRQAAACGMTNPQ